MLFIGGKSGLQRWKSCVEQGCGDDGSGVRSLFSSAEPSSRKRLGSAGGNDVDNVRSPKNFNLRLFDRNQLAIDPLITQDVIPANFPAGMPSSAHTCIPPGFPC